MTADDLIELLKERPFKPLQIHLADGRVREVRQANMAIVAKDTVVIGEPSARDPRIAARMYPCSISSIVNVKRIGSDDPDCLADALSWL